MHTTQWEERGVKLNHRVLDPSNIIRHVRSEQITRLLQIKSK
jgi:hypothetical protein